MRTIPALAVLLGQVLAGTATGDEIRSVVISGDPTPDGTGVFGTFGDLAVNDSAALAFVAYFTEPPSTLSRSGVVRATADGSELRFVARYGDPVPDGDGTIGNLRPDAAAINAAGQVAFLASFVGTAGGGFDDAGILRSEANPDLLTLLAREADFPYVNLWGPSNIPTLNASGQVAFPAPASFGIYLNTNGTSTLVGAPGGGPLLQFAPEFNDLGQLAFLKDFLTGGTLRTGLFRTDGVQLVEMFSAPSSTIPPDGIRPPFTYALNDHGEAAFISPDTHGIAAGNSLFRTDGLGPPVPIARNGDPVPGGNGRFWQFDRAVSFRRPALNDVGEVAFVAALAETSMGTLDDLGLFRGDGEELTQIVRKGDPAPDGNGVLATIGPIAINNAGQVAFTATFTGALIDGIPSPSEGILIYDDARGLVTVARTGDCCLRGLRIGLGLRFGPLTPSLRTRGALNDRGQLAFHWAGYGDGPPVAGVAVYYLPEPGARLMLVIAVLTLAALQRRKDARRRARLATRYAGVGGRVAGVTFGVLGAAGSLVSPSMANAKAIRMSPATSKKV